MLMIIVMSLTFLYITTRVIAAWVTHGVYLVRYWLMVRKQLQDDKRRK